MSKGNRRGRPVGYKLSEESKEKIRRSRLGKHHSKTTKNKISKSLVKYFREKDPLSESLEREYNRISDEASEWVSDMEDELNDCRDILTSKRLIYLNQIEISYGSDIERFCHNATPEFLLLLKEELSSGGLKEELEELNSLLRGV